MSTSIEVCGHAFRVTPDYGLVTLPPPPSNLICLLPPDHPNKQHAAVFASEHHAMAQQWLSESPES